MAKLACGELFRYRVYRLMLNLSGEVNTADWPAGEEVKVIVGSEAENCAFKSLEERFGKINLISIREV